MIRTVIAERYVVPLREGGSLPAVVEADDGVLYVMKFVGAGQGPKALIAELVAGEIGRALGLNVPEIVLMEMSPLLGRSEPNPEIRSLLQASAGLNLGLRYLPSSFSYSQLLRPPMDAPLASAIVWFDAYVTNVDRTDRNVNLLLWQQEIWLIDHGAALFFHHNWQSYQQRIRSPFPMIRDHTLLPQATQLLEADQLAHARLDRAQLTQIVGAIPAVWLSGEAQFPDVDAFRAAYVEYLEQRLAASNIFVEEAIRARQLRV